jgi:hypothetical protein
MVASCTQTRGLHEVKVTIVKSGWRLWRGDGRRHSLSLFIVQARRLAQLFPMVTLSLTSENCSNEAAVDRRQTRVKPEAEEQNLASTYWFYPSHGAFSGLCWQVQTV